MGMNGSLTSQCQDIHIYEEGYYSVTLYWFKNEVTVTINVNNYINVTIMKIDYDKNILDSILRMAYIEFRKKHEHGMTKWSEKTRDDFLYLETFIENAHARIYKEMSKF
jgi:hypothetical protein